MLISETLRDALCQQIISEKFNQNLYLSVAGYLRNKGLDNLAKHFIKQSGEESEHAMQIFDLLTDLNADVFIGEIDEVRVSIPIQPSAHEVEVSHFERAVPLAA